ncbi:MAG: amidohydrolase [Pseudohongiellaceae bacterium]|uniref:Amidohydrolase n=1 Tax=OM182 bacterium MED-G28 TaxID=1986256 RepID=A0A2A5WAP1_9GAMM|nr:MAG: amidohydrolase [OM182 bacterium MED-G28]
MASHSSMNIEKLKLVVLVPLFALAGCSPQVELSQEAPSSADLIFIGDNIITMDDNVASAVAVIGDRISAVGSREEILAMRGETTQFVDLGARALLPGFIDAHGHFGGVATYSALLDLSSPPVGAMENIDDIVAAIRNWIEVNNVPAGDLVYGVGYDDSLLVELRHPNRDDLDRASTTHPIVIRHVSGHLSSANSLALANYNIGVNTENPAGGIVRRRLGTNEPDGVMEETAMGLLPGTGVLVDEELGWRLRREAADIYASFGITTIQESNVSTSYVEALKQQALEEPFAVDIVTYIMGNPLSDEELELVSHDSDYSGGVKIGGVKFTLDGSPQGRTAWMSQPYNAGPPGVDADYVAYPSYDPDAYRQRVDRLLERGVPVLAHANGDEAIELMIDGIEESLSGEEMPDHRSVIIHAQLIREDQLDRVKQLGIVPSYYAAHPFFWGDWHRLSFGDDRASFISPVKATIERDIPFTVHNDSPIVPPDIMRLVSITVNRLTRSGYVLGPDQRASVLEALYSVTQGAAYQYFEEDEKGSITVGKRADFVVLESNPLTIDPLQLENVGVVETFARGKSVYRQVGLN